MADDAKVCSACHQEKPLSAFNRSRRSRDGLQRQCADCSATQKRQERERKAAATAAAYAQAPAGPNELAAVATIAALRASGELREVDADRAQAAVSLARAVDASPTSAALWSSYLRAMAAVRIRRPADVAAAKAASSASLIARVRGNGPRRPGTPKNIIQAAETPPRARRRAEPTDPTLLPPEGP
jgi:hypothetical protein